MNNEYWVRGGHSQMQNLPRTHDTFEHCRNDIAKFYGEPYVNQQSNLGIKGEALAGVILERYSASTLAAVFASRKDGGTIVTKMGARIKDLEAYRALCGDEPAQQMVIDGKISILREMIEECIRS